LLDFFSDCVKIKNNKKWQKRETSRTESASGGIFMKKRYAAIFLAAAVAVGAGINISEKKPVLLENEAAETDLGEEIFIDDGAVPMADLPSEEPEDDYAGLDETQIEYVREVLELVNKARAEEGLAPLALEPALREAAQVRAAECVGTFSHTRPDGSRYSTAILEAGIEASYMGENVATGYKTPSQVVDGWLDSEGHRANILDPNYTKIGIGLEKNTGNRYKGYAWAQLFIK